MGSEKEFDVMWKVERLEDIMRHWMKGYILPEGAELVSRDWWVDTRRDNVVVSIVTKRRKAAHG